MKRTIRQWLDNGWLRPHKTTPEEIENLFQIVDRDLKDACSELSADWRFGIAYNAALKGIYEKTIFRTLLPNLQYNPAE